MFHPFIPNNVNQDFVAAKYSAVKVSLFQKCKKKKKSRLHYIILICSLLSLYQQFYSEEAEGNGGRWRE